MGGGVFMVLILRCGGVGFRFKRRDSREDVCVGRLEVELDPAD